MIQPDPIFSCPPSATDAEILARVAAGEVNALGELYDRYASAILCYVMRAVPGEDAEDVVQVTFVRVFRVAGSFRRDAPSARPWLYGIAIAVLRERRRSLRRFFHTLGLLSHQTQEPSQWPRALRPDVEHGLRTLSEPKRLALLLAEVEGFSCEEIAAALSIPVSTVWTRLHHARRQLRASLRKH